MTALDDALSPRGALVGLVSRMSRGLGTVTRRNVFLGAAVAGSALVTDPRRYVIQPVSAYATICGPGNPASSGWTVFCCTVNKGVNACPPGSFAAGWWKAADSSWCGSGYRYIVDCNATCTSCSSGCTGDHICDSSCWSCRCGTGSTATCDQRRVCCNAFRYGQCNTQVTCSGGVHCRVVSCVPPYQWTNCSTTSLSDNRTSEHSAPCLPQWGAIAAKYKSMGEQGSYLKASMGPVKSVGDGRGTCVAYQGGAIYSTATTGTRALSKWVQDFWAKEGGPRGPLGYVTTDRYTGRRDGGWIQFFEHGAICDSASTTTQSVWGIRYTVWTGAGREAGSLGYPVGPRTDLPGGAWIQLFQYGAITDSTATSTQSVWGIRYQVWVREGRETGTLGFPTSARTDLANGAWIQLFQCGALTDSTATTTQAVWGAVYQGWARLGREKGRLGFPTGAVTKDSRGVHETFQGGELWVLGSGAAKLVYGAVLTAWKQAGGATGRYGYPLTDTTTTADGRLTCTFENGSITA